MATVSDSDKCIVPAVEFWTSSKATDNSIALPSPTPTALRMTKPPLLAITSVSLSPASTNSPLEVINSTAFALVLPVLTELSVILPSAVISTSPVLLEIRAPSAIKTAPLFNPTLVSAVIAIVPSIEVTSPNSPNSTSCSALIPIVDVVPVVCTTPLITVEALAGALPPSATTMFPTAKT